MAAALPTVVIDSVGLAEVVTKLRERGLSIEEVEEALGGLRLQVPPPTKPTPRVTCGRRRAQGLSLGVRACLALAVELSAAVLTTHQAWGGVEAGVEVEMIW